MPRSFAAATSAAWTLTFHCSSQSSEPGIRRSSSHQVSKTSAEILYDWWNAHRTNASSGRPHSARLDGSGSARCESFGW